MKIMRNYIVEHVISGLAHSTTKGSICMEGNTFRYAKIK